ncbi:MAG: RNA polymerase sigma factor [Desulfobacterales bacterium]|nr:RNA polymerase sigma factor [Desulfobacterales bacterium]
MNRSKTQAARFEQLLAPHMNTLYKTAWRLVGKADEAEDLVQQVLEKIYPQTKKLETIEQLGPWLKKVVYREFVDNYRKRVRRPENYPAEKEDALENLRESEDNPETLVLRAENRQRVLRALDRLDGDNRALVVMHLAEGYTLAELAEIFQIPAETVKTRLRRARARLKKNLLA